MAMATPTASPGFIQGLLSSLAPWMTGANPSALDNSFSQYGGTQGLLDAMMQGAGPDTSQAREGAALQRARALALQEAGQRQQLAQGAIGTQLMASKLPAIQAYYRMLGGMMGTNAPNGSSQTTNNGAPSALTPSSQNAPPLIRAPQLAAGGQQQPAPMAASPSPSQGGFWSNPLGVMRFGTLGAALGLPGGQQFADYGKTAIQYDPATATRMALAKDPVTLDRAQLYEAYRSGNPQAIQAAQNKFLTDTGMQHIGSMSGIYTRVEPDGSVTTYNPSTGLQTNTKTGASYMPGALQALAAREGAEKAAELRAETNPAGASGVAPSARAPSQNPTPVSPPSAAAPAEQPNQFGVPPAFQGAAAERQQNFIPPVLASPSNIAQRPGNTSLGQLESFQKEQADKASNEADDLNDKAENAQQLITQADQIQRAAADFTPGRYALVKGEILAALQPTGLLTDQQIKELGSYQEGQKLAIQLQASATKQLGSREAAQIFDKMGKSMPNLTLSPDGLAKISAYLKGIARYNIALNTFCQRLAAQGNVAGVNNLQSNFQQYSNPVFFILASAPPAQRAELIRAMPDAKDTLAQWRKAAEMGLAPGPFDYQGQ